MNHRHRSGPPARYRRTRVGTAALTTFFVLSTVVGTLTPTAPTSAQTSSSGKITKIGEFDPFGPDDEMPSSLNNVVDWKRRTWFFISPLGNTDGVNGVSHVWQIDLDTMKVEGDVLDLGGAPPVGNALPSAVDEETGALIMVLATAGRAELVAVEATPTGPRIVERLDIANRLARDITGTELDEVTTEAGGRLAPVGMAVRDGKIYVGADAGSFGAAAPEVGLLRFDLAKLLDGEDAFDWRFGVDGCPMLARGGNFHMAAVGVSDTTPRVTLPCRVDILDKSTRQQGVVVIDMTSDPDDPSGFASDFHPLGANLESAFTYFDPATERMMLRTNGPNQIMAFDVRHGAWMRPFVFGEQNMHQSAFDPASGRLYGFGDQVQSGGQGTSTVEYLYAAEPRPTPPQNGLVQRFESEWTPDDANRVGKGPLAVDPATGRIFVADFRVADGARSRDLMFHVFEDPRASLAEHTRPNPDESVAALSGEAQGYGARASWVGGTGGTYSNAAGGTDWPFGGEVAPGTRHLTFARTLELRIGNSGSKGSAIEAHPEGATTAELQNHFGQPWFYEAASCLDFGGNAQDATAPRGGATAVCDAALPAASTSATYAAEPTSPSNDPFSLPVQNATTSAQTRIDPERGVVTTVTSEASLDIPGILRIGRVTATAESWANGVDGGAGSTYERTMEDVVIGGEPFCQVGCTPATVAAAINEHFANTKDSGMVVEAKASDPDPALRGSPGGVEAIVQRDFWLHEEDIGVNDMPVDRNEHPAFELMISRDKTKGERYLYWLAGVQAVSRNPGDTGNDADFTPTSDTSPPPPTLSTFTGGSEAPQASTSVEPERTIRRRIAGSEPAKAESPASPAPAPSFGDQVRDFLSDVLWGLRSPLDSPGILAVWAFLAGPLYLSSRRWLMLRRQQQIGDLA